MTVKLHVDVRLALSVALHVTTLLPKLKLPGTSVDTDGEQLRDD